MSESSKSDQTTLSRIFYDLGSEQLVQAAERRRPSKRLEKEERQHSHG